MRSLTGGHFKAGMDAMRGAKTRNFWTMFGVIIGVSSVITVVSIGQGITTEIKHQIDHFGTDLILVRSAQASDSSGLIGATGGVSLSQRDLDVVTTTRGVAAHAPLSTVPGTVKADNGVYHDGRVFGTTADLPTLLNQSMAFGVFLTDSDAGQNVAVLGSHAADAMFNQDVPLGRTFSFHGQQFIVHGVLNQFDNTPLSQGADLNNAIFIPQDTGQALTNNAAVTFQILAKPTNSSQVGRVQQDITRSLNALHGDSSDLVVLKANQASAGTSTVLSLLTRLIAGVAAISLLVGGIGIMNVMLVSVAERTHEIGIRKAVGASNRQIRSQFMIEASVLSLTGGIIGIILAGLIDVGLRLGTNLKPQISWQIVALASGVSLLVGIIFGTVPAAKAARKDPIAALRGE